MNMENYSVRKDGKQLLPFFLKVTSLPPPTRMFEDVLNVSRLPTFVPHVLFLDAMVMDKVEVEERMEEEEDGSRRCPNGDT